MMQERVKTILLGLFIVTVFSTAVHAESNTKNALKLDKSLNDESMQIVKIAKQDSENPPYLNSARRANCTAGDFQQNAPIGLSDVLQRVLCASPTLMQAIKSIDEKQAGVDLARSTFRPRISANAEYATDRIPSNNSSAGSLSRSATGSINLSWVLFDFGTRDANLAQARHMLTSALITQESATILTMTEALRIYTEALTAYGKLKALNEAESTANQSLVIAQARYDAKVGGLAEKLQAQTALAQARLERSRANGVWVTARGALATIMGVNVQTPLILMQPEAAFPAIDSLPRLEAILEEINTSHPRIRAVRAEMAALDARLQSVQSEYKGTVSLASGAAETKAFNDPTNAGFNRNVNISLQANIPLFAGKEQSAREGQIAAQIAMKETQIQQIQNEISNDVWKSTQQTITETENLAEAEELLTSASQNYEIALGRYQAGVGSILDLLLSQTTLAKAHQQVQESKINNIQARIRLALVAGRMPLQEPR